jgi:hypothetical protein
MIARAAVPLALLLATLALAACGEKDEGTSADLPVGCEPVEAPAPKTEQVRRPPREPQLQGEDVTALIETSCGPVEIALETRRFPKTTSSFAHLVEAGFYKRPQFAVLGEVTYGIEVIDRIAELREPGSETGAPRAPVVIGRVTLTYR